MNRIIRVFTVSALAAGIAACGGGNDTGNTGTVSIGLTDAPALEFSNVTVAFTGMSLKPEGGKWIEFDFARPKTWNLLELQGGLSEPLITDEEVPAGAYSEIRLYIDTSQSFANLASAPDVPKTLAAPSGEQSGLKLKGEMVVAADTTTDFTIDFDVQKSIVDPQGESLADYLLKPTLRLVNNLEVGSISGQVDYGTINQDPNLTDCSADYEGAIYVYTGADASPTDLNVSLEEAGPLMTIPVTDQDMDGLYEYTAAFLPAGDYTISYSCQLDDNETTDKVEFLGTQNVSVIPNTDTKAETIPLVL
ncbi:DUF4382 domain-containing protein [Marinobacter salinisoli]|uniref:DUF4382 domain-containing protein n=1 Tax=Marinobacter salinisoli TaxID=2769486 RepID=A0ABX7MUW3_9GAMM|nr:DUF4382 domain-containing protein [Marinobacter salinisoli]QSP95963.1 DUF4382 domain-containing protein [Marinobacter salinisoli]